MSELGRKLILFTRYPIVGRAKTRLIPALGAEGQAALHRRQVPELVRGIRWVTDRVLADSLAVLEHQGWKAALLDPLADIDRPEDLPVWRRIAASEDARLDRVSVIIPALNEERHIDATLRA